MVTRTHGAKAHSRQKSVTIYTLGKLVNNNIGRPFWQCQFQFPDEVIQRAEIYVLEGSVSPHDRTSIDYKLQHVVSALAYVT